MASPVFKIPNAAFHSPKNVALIPILKRFKLTNDSPLITQILLEQQLVDTVSLVRVKEREVRNKVKKDEAEANEQAKSDNGKESKKKSKKQSKECKKAREDAGRSLEHILDAYDRTKERLNAQAQRTQQAIVTHHGAILQKMDSASGEEHDLFGSAYKELWDNDKRHLYVKEMIPVMKQVGEENNVDDVIQLPYVRLFQITDAQSPIVSALVTDQHLLEIHTELSKRIAKPDSEQKKLIKSAEVALSKHSEATIALIQKHYRRQSVKIHPDRKGESYRKVFEDFTNARNVLKDERLRRLYLKEMIVVVKTFGKSYIDSSHDAWNNKNRPDIAERGDKQRQGKPMRLGGGLHEQMPRGPMLQHQCGKVTVSVHVLRPLHEFFSRVKRITVMFQSIDDDDRNVLVLDRKDIVKEIKYDRRGDMYGNSIDMGGVDNLNPGGWEVSWFAIFDSVGVDPTDPYNATEDEIVSKRSSVAQFNVKDMDYEIKLEQFMKAENSCRICMSELQSALNKLRNLSGSEPVRRYGLHHEVVVLAGKKSRALKRVMNATGKTSAVFDDLNSMLVSSREELFLLEERIENTKKKKVKQNMLRNFKDHIAGVVESADPASWMENVTLEQLKNEGGDANRLYQLFIEGRGQFQIMVDYDMLRGAALRHDIFSSKQCAELELRREDTLIQEEEEEEKNRAAEEERQADESARKKLLRGAELERKWAMVGNTVTVNGLTSSEGGSLNGKAASVVDYSQEKDRFEVKFANVKETVFLKNENIKLYFYGQQLPQVIKPGEPISPKHTGTAEPWVCPHCTFMNEKDHKNCDMCTKSRPPKPETEVPEHTGEMRDIIESEAHMNASTGSKTPQLKNTLWVTSSFSKKLIGKKGRKKKELMARSGAEIKIDTQGIYEGLLPVHFMGSEIAVRNAISCVKVIVGAGNTFVDPPIVNGCTDAEDRNTVNHETNSPEIIPPLMHLSQSLDKYAATKDAESTVGIGHEFPGFHDLTLDESISSIADSDQTSRASAQPGVLLSSLSSLQEDGLELLLDFLHEQEACIKGDVNEFFKWLLSEDIDTIYSLKEAVSDEEYLRVCLQVGNGAVGLKGFKRNTFQRAVTSFYRQIPKEYASPTSHRPSLVPSPMRTVSPAQDTQYVEHPNELYCPIGNVIMVDEPVLVGDGFTYEKSSIEKWFSAKVREIIAAEENLKSNPNSVLDREVASAGIRSPITGESLPHLTLTPNNKIKDMAHHFAQHGYTQA